MYNRQAREEIFAGEADNMVEFFDDFDDSLDSPTDFDEYEMNPDDCAPDPGDPFDMEYDR